ncbi:MAG: hypothetical protein ACYC2Z_05895 [Candidatus Nanopelagicales bacterium]
MEGDPFANDILEDRFVASAPLDVRLGECEDSAVVAGPGGDECRQRLGLVLPRVVAGIARSDEEEVDVALSGVVTSSSGAEEDPECRWRCPGPNLGAKAVEELVAEPGETDHVGGGEVLTVESVEIGATGRASADYALLGEPAEGVVDAPDARSIEQSVDVSAGEVGLGEGKHAEHVAIESGGDDRERL